MTLRPIKVPFVGDNKTGRVFRQVERDAKKLSGRLAGIGGALGLGIGVSGLALLVKQTIQADAQLAKLANRISVSTEFMSELKFASKSTSSEFEQLYVAVQRMGRRIGQFADDTGEAKASLERLGFTAEDLKGIGLEKQFELILRQLQGITDENERLKIAQKIFDSEGVSVVELAGNFEQLRQKARDLGISLSTEAADKALEADAAFNDLAATAQSVAREIGLLVSGPLVLLARALLDINSAVGQLSFDALLGEWASQTKAIDQLNEQIERQADIRSANMHSSEREKEAIDSVSRALVAELEERQRRLEIIEREIALRRETGSFGAPPAPAPVTPRRPLGNDSNEETPEQKAAKQLELYRKRAAQIREGIKSDIERFNDSITEATILKSLGLLEPADFNRRIQQIVNDYYAAQKKIADKTDDTSKEIEDFYDRAFDAAADGFEGLKDLAIRTLNEIIAEYARKQLFEVIFGKKPGDGKSGSGGNILGDIFSVLGGGDKSTPSTFTSPGSGKSVVIGAGKATPAFVISQTLNVSGETSDIEQSWPRIRRELRQDAVSAVLDLARSGRLQVRSPRG